MRRQLADRQPPEMVRLGTPVATAARTAVINTCEFEDCHTGAYASYQVVLIVSGALTCLRGSRAYARLQYMFVGHFNAWPSSVTDQVIAPMRRHTCRTRPRAPDTEVGNA
jgi:hypothetical protein